MIPAGVDCVNQSLQCLPVEQADLARRQIGEFGGVWRNTGRVDHDPGMRFQRRFPKPVGVVPDHVEIADDLLDQRLGRHTSAAMLQRRQIGRADADRRRHISLGNALRVAELTQPFAKGRHELPACLLSLT